MSINYPNATGESLKDFMGEHPSVKMWGAVGDGKMVNDAEISSGETTLTSASGKFIAGDVGKPITVDGAGAAGAILKTTIASYTSATEVELTNAASTTVSQSTSPQDNAHAWWGTDDSSAINTAIASVGAASEGGGGTLYIPVGIYIVSVPIQMQPGVTLHGHPTYNRYAFDTGVHLPLQSQIKTAADFPADSYVIDAGDVSHFGIHNLEITGDGTSEMVAYDATCTGILIGTADEEDGADSIMFAMSYTSVTNCKRGVWGKNFGGCRWYNCNIGPCWYIGVDFEKYAGNDGTYVNIMINSCNWDSSGVADPVEELYTGTGLRLGHGCGHQSWIGGKIEWNATGILLDEKSWNCYFTGIHFDANYKWHVRIRGTDEPDDIQTFAHRFMNCRFSGGGNDSDVVAAGLDAHALIEGQTTEFSPCVVAVSFVGCSFKAVPPGTAYENWGTFPQYPKNQTIATRVIGAGAGSPIIDLIVSECDLEHSSVKAGNCNTSGTAVTKTSGDDFDVTGFWTGKEFRFYTHNRFTIGSVGGASALTLTGDAGSYSDKPWFVEVNKINIADGFSVYSEIRIHDNLGIPNRVTHSESDTRDLFDYVNSAGNSIWRMTNGGDAYFSGWAYGLKGVTFQNDVGGVIYIGRYDDVFLGSVIDFYDVSGTGDDPEFVSIRFAGTEKARLTELGRFTAVDLKAKGHIITKTDEGSIVYLGRYSAAYAGVVVDFYDEEEAGSKSPTFVSWRFGGTEWAKWNKEDLWTQNRGLEIFAYDNLKPGFLRVKSSSSLIQGGQSLLELLDGATSLFTVDRTGVALLATFLGINVAGRTVDEEVLRISGRFLIEDDTIRFDNETAERAVYLDASKDLKSSTVTATEQGYLSGVTSSIQDQLSAKQDTTGAWTGSFVNGDGNNVTVVNGRITAVTAP